MPLAFAETQISVDVTSNESVTGYFDLNSPNNDIYVNGVNYKGYVDYKVYETANSMDRDEIARTLELGWRTFLGMERNPLNYELGIAEVFYEIIDYTLDYVHSSWVLPIQIKQNAIIQTLEDAGLTEQYCKNLAEVYFKAYNDESFKCENNNQTYYRDMKFSIKLQS